MTTRAVGDIKYGKDAYRTARDTPPSPSKTWNTFVPLRAFQALFAASCFGHTTLVANLLDNAASNFEMLSKNRHSVLHVAASKGHVECVSLLLSRGADPKLADLEGIYICFLANNNHAGI